MSRPSRGSWVVIDPGAIRGNARALLRRCRGARLVAVVKEDAYGHGALTAARALRGLAAGFAVASIEEGEALRRGGIRGEILVLVSSPPEVRARAARADLTLTLAGEQDLFGIPSPRVGALRAHLKVDTGMGRLGVPPGDLPALARLLVRRGVRRLAGMYTHLASGSDRPRTARQVAALRIGARILRAAGVDPGPLHAANSEAVLASPEACALGTIRPGLLLYGCRPAAGARGLSLAPAMAFKTRVLAVREAVAGDRIGYGGTWTAPRRSRLAVLPVGYAAGYSRLQSNRGVVLVRGRPAPVRGRVSMNLTLVDVTRIGGVRPGDEAVLVGAQGRARVRAEDVARRQATIPYEVLCVAGGLNPREFR